MGRGVVVREDVVISDVGIWRLAGVVDGVGFLKGGEVATEG